MNFGKEPQPGEIIYTDRCAEAEPTVRGPSYIAHSALGRVPGASAPKMETLRDRIDENTVRTYQVARLLETFADRIFGPAPEGDDTKPSIGDSLSERLRDGSDAVQLLERQAARLEGIA